MDQRPADATLEFIKSIFAEEPDDVDDPRCPLCDGEMDPRPVRNALSRLDNSTYVCSRCGVREACAPQRPTTNRRSCLYRDDVMGIAVVHANISGYTPWLKKPASTPFADAYVDAWNTKLGITKDAQSDIVASSMFGDDHA